MGDTVGYLKGKVLVEDLLNIIRQKIDPNARITSSKFNTIGSDSDCSFIEKRYDDTGLWLIYNGNILFNDGVNNRTIFTTYTNHNSYQNLDYYKRYYGGEEMVKSETTYISTPAGNKSVEIMKEIMSIFGGWMIENDSNEPLVFYEIDKNESNDVKPAIHVTMRDIYEKFGGIVIIDPS